MFLGEVAGFASLNVDDTNHAILGDERDGQFRSHIGNGFDISRILGDVVDQNGLAQLSSKPGNAFTDFDASAVSEFLRIADLKAESQVLRLLIEQQDGENFVVDDLADDFGDATDGRVQVERRGQDVGNVEK